MKTWKEVFQHLLFVRHIEWARTWVGGWVYKHGGLRFKDDLENIALTALWQMCKVHDPDRYAYQQFLGLATMGMEQRMRDFLRREWLQARHIHFAGSDDPYWDLTEAREDTGAEIQLDPAPESSLLYFPTEGRCREAAYLYFFMGMSMREIGDQLECSHVQIHRLLRRGVALAREKLGVSEDEIDFVVARKHKVINRAKRE